MCDTSPNSIKNEVNGSGKNSKMLHGAYLRSPQLKLPSRAICSTGHWDLWGLFLMLIHEQAEDGLRLCYCTFQLRPLQDSMNLKNNRSYPRQCPQLPQQSCPAASQPPPRSTWFTQHPQSLSKVTRRQEQDTPLRTGPSQLQNCRFWCQPEGRNTHFCSLKSALGSGFMHKRSTGGLIKPLCPIIHKWSTLCSHTSVVLSNLPQALPLKPVHGLAARGLCTLSN